MLVGCGPWRIFQLQGRTQQKLELPSEVISREQGLRYDAGLEDAILPD